MDTRFRVMTACAFAFLWVGGHCGACQSDTCENAPDEVVKHSEAHALLQKKSQTESITEVATEEEEFPDELLQKGSNTRQTPPSFPQGLTCFSYVMTGECNVKLPDGKVLEGSCGVSADGMTGTCRTNPSWSGVCATTSTPGSTCEWAGFSGMCTFDPYLGTACNVWAGYKPTEKPTEKPTDPPASGCPAECKSPTCRKGSGSNGGFPLQHNGVCAHTCSKKYGQTRYCGQGTAYFQSGSIDCSGCKDTCPQTCYEPAVLGGNPANGGIELTSLKCLHVASKPFAGIRYCGNGMDYLKGNSLDCTPCAHEKPTPAPPTDTCSPECSSPKCLEGGAHNGGWGLVDGKCNFHCSKKYDGFRFCGTGDAYKTEGSIDCRPCMKHTYVPAPDWSIGCPKTPTMMSLPINDIEECKKATEIEGTKYTWTGIIGCQSQQWPRGGCFTWSTNLYFSTCESTRPLSQYSHYGVCKVKGR